MPHVDIKYFPRDLTDEQKKALSKDVSLLITQHFGSKESAISLALEEVSPENWKAQVWDTQIAPQMERLTKKPGYSM